MTHEVRTLQPGWGKSMIRTLMIAILLSLFLGNTRATTIRANAHDLPDVRVELVDAAVDAALEVETPTVPAETLLAIAWGESRMEPGQRTGVVCGAMQVNPIDLDLPRAACDVWARDTHQGFAAGARELAIMLADHRVHGDIRKALLYRACGNAAFDGTCAKTAWPAWVLARARALRNPSNPKHRHRESTS